MKISCINNYYNKPINIKPKTASFKGRDNDIRDELWEDNYSMSMLRAHALFEAGAHECFNIKVHSIPTENISDEEAKKLDFDYNSLKKLPVNNLTITTNRKGVRGSCLLEKNKKYLNDLKKAGINQVIDLRETNNPAAYSELCKENGLKYVYFPINGNNEMTQYNKAHLADLIKAINDGNFYIACAEGINRTDITLALNYLVNPNEKIVPHLKSRSPLQAIKYAQKNMKIFTDNFETPEEKEAYFENLGWRADDKSAFEAFNQEYKNRNIHLTSVNRKH